MELPTTPKAPSASTAAISASMRGNTSTNTRPERTVRLALRAAGYPGYRLHWDRVPGRPDIAYPGRRIAVFVNGCYWHRCPSCNLALPKSNIEYWSAKFERNTTRDARNLRALEVQGWRVIVIWECEVNHNVEGSIAPVLTLLRASE